MIGPASAEHVFADLLREVDTLLPRDAAGEPDAAHEHADVVADLLGYLAQQMTDLHRQRQEEVADFLEWLEARIGCPVDELAGKTAVREYYRQESGVEKLLEVLQRNHPARVKIDVSAPEGYRERNPERQRIADGYEHSMRTLRPILLQIQLTDRLIDLIVYRLYGLTAAEQALVEGRDSDDVA